MSNINLTRKQVVIWVHSGFKGGSREMSRYYSQMTNSSKSRALQGIQIIRVVPVSCSEKENAQNLKEAFNTKIKTTNDQDLHDIS